MNTLFSNNFGLMHFFHRIDFLIFFELHTPNLTESSFANHILTIKMLPINVFIIKIHVVLHDLLGLQFRQIDFKTILDILIGFFRDGRVTSIMLFLSFRVQIFAFASLLVQMRSTRHDYAIIAIDAVFPILVFRLPGVVRSCVVTLNRHFNGIYLRFAASMRIKYH